MDQTSIFAIPNKGEISSAGSEHLPYKQRVTGSNPVSPTKPHTANTGGVFSFNSAQSLPEDIEENLRFKPSIAYSVPKLNKGKELKLIPRGSSKDIEQAKLNWYIESISVIIVNLRWSG